MLQLRIVEIVKKFAEAVEQIALGNDDEDWEASTQGAMDGIQLLGNLGGLLFQRVRRVLHERLGGNHQNHAVDGAVRPAGLEQVEEFLPLGRAAGRHFFKHQTAGGIQN